MAQRFEPAEKAEDGTPNDETPVATAGAGTDTTGPLTGTTGLTTPDTNGLSQDKHLTAVFLFCT